MTLRRRKKRPAPPPPDYPEDKNVSSLGTASSGLDNVASSYSTPMSHSTDCIPHQLSRVAYINGHQDNTHSNNGSTYTLNSMCDSTDDITGSLDDVFSDAVGDTPVTSKFTPACKLVPNHCDSKTDWKPVSNGRAQTDYVKTDPVEKYRTQSTSAIEDVLKWKTVNIDIANDEVDYVNTAEMARRRRGKGLSPLNQNFNIKSDMSSYKSDPELVNIHKSFQKKSRKLWRYNERSQTPTSCCSSRSDSGFSNSSAAAAGKKRVVTKMHLLKDENGLGIHIAGGKGSKKGDIGIFVAGVMETGAAYKDGRLKRGDELLMINGKSLIGLTHTEAVDVLRNSPKLVQLVVATKVRKAASIASSVSCSYSSLTPCPNSMLTTSQSFDATGCDQSDLSGFGNLSGDQIVPELTAQTPHGTFIKWDELFEKFKTDGLCSETTDKKEEVSEKKAAGRKKWRFAEPQTLTINKGVRGKGLGFTIVGGSDSEKGNLGIFVRRILTSGLIHEEGSIKEGDEILEVNGTSISGLCHKEALSKFRKLKKGPVKLVFRHKIGSRPPSPSMRSGGVTPVDFSSDGSPVSTPGNSPYGSVDDLTNIDVGHNGSKNTGTGQTDHPSGHLLRLPGQSDSYKYYGSSRSNTEDKNLDLADDKTSGETDVDHVTLQKEYGIGLGVSLLRRDTNGVSHIYIQDIAQGSVADKDGRLRKGDRIVKAGGRSLRDTTLLDAYQVFRNLLAGPVTLVIIRGSRVKTITINLPPDTADQLNTNYQQEGPNTLTETSPLCSLPSEDTFCQPCHPPSEDIGCRAETGTASLDGAIFEPLNLQPEATCQTSNPPWEDGIGQPPNPPWEGGTGQPPNLPREGGTGQPPNPPWEGGTGQPPNLPREGGTGQPPNPPICEPYDLIPDQFDGLSPGQSLNEDEFLV